MSPIGRYVAATLSETPRGIDKLPRRSSDAFRNIHQLEDK